MLKGRADVCLIAEVAPVGHSPSAGRPCMALGVPDQASDYWHHLNHLASSWNLGRRKAKAKGGGADRKNSAPD